jgi:hypothetical protein
VRDFKGHQQLNRALKRPEDCGPRFLYLAGTPDPGVYPAMSAALAPKETS